MRRYKFIARATKPLMGLVGHIVKNESGEYFYAPKQCHRIEFKSKDCEVVENYLIKSGCLLEFLK